MSSTFHGLELGRRSLFAQQAALNTTGHNIGNANSKGYSRQRVELTATPALSYPGLNNDRSPRQLGTGVTPSEITRVREDYLDVQFRSESHALGYWEATQDIYARIEEIINEPSDEGLQKMMDLFMQGWQDLAKNPESLAARAVVRERGVAIGEAFGHMMSSLDQIEADLNQVIQTKVSEINSFGTQLSRLNDEIMRLVPHGYQPNDLFDQRDALIDQLSKLVPTETRQGANGMVEVLVGGQSFVNGTQAQQMTFDTAVGEFSLGGGTLSLASGELAGLIEGRGKLVDEQPVGIIPSMRLQLNRYAAAFAKELNDVHQSGYNLTDMEAVKTDPSALPEKLLFFVDPSTDPPSSPQGAVNFAVNPLILTSLDQIAAAGTLSIGDGTKAQEVVSLKSKTITIAGQSSTLDDYYRFTVAQLGVQSQEARRMADNSEVLVTQVENRRHSVSGVSIDEEMSNMIMFQQAYNASARYVTAVDEILDKIINGMGRVGL